ncbi:MAG: hypothetical protein K2H83_08610 [Duncaniella sp.]|nr:hypothetical protein [Duncaniella sp.]MDE5735182.1 hypothetical protein [Duncaniella sp.]MDE6177801.1 hypothetical protein [Duncaniella sp.]
MNRKNLSAILPIAGLLAIMTASALPLLRMGHGWFGWLYAAGALLVLVGRLLNRVPKDCPLRLKRLLRMEVWTALVFAAGAVFTFLNDRGGNDWLAFTMAGGVLTVYTSIMIPRLRSSAPKAEK